MSVYVWILAAAAFWGCTDPLLKLFGDKTRRKTEEREEEKGIASHLKGLFANWKYSTAFLVNQLGSVAFFKALSEGASVSTAVPAANGLKVVFGLISGALVGERRPTSRAATGMLFVLVGIALQAIPRDA